MLKGNSMNLYAFKNDKYRLLALVSRDIRLAFAGLMLTITAAISGYLAQLETTRSTTIVVDTRQAPADASARQDRAANASKRTVNPTTERRSTRTDCALGESQRVETSAAPRTVDGISGPRSVEPGKSS